jgi:hypothetical protein
VVVTVALMGVMQVAGDEVVDVVAVRDGLVSAALAVDMLRLVRRAVVAGPAVVGVVAVDLELVLVHVVAMDMVEVAVVDVVGVTGVNDGRVPAVGAVDVFVMGVVKGAGRHDDFSGVVEGLGTGGWVWAAWASALSMSSRTCVSASW